MARRVLPRGVADLSAAVVRDGRGIAAEPGARPNPTGRRSSTNCRAPPSRSAAAPLEAAAAQSTAGHLLDFRSPQVARRPACSTRYNNPPAHTNVPGRRGCDAMHFAMSRLDLRHCPQRPNPGNEKGSFFFLTKATEKTKVAHQKRPGTLLWQVRRSVANQVDDIRTETRRDVRDSAQRV